MRDDRSTNLTSVGPAIQAFERLPLPDALTRFAIRTLVGRTSRSLKDADADATAAFAQEISLLPVALNVEDANLQHYEVPETFFALVLGPQRKYSCCLYDTPGTTLAEAEEKALAATAEHAQLADGQSILELGCGWGSLSLWIARRFPNAKILSVSNSHSQRRYIERRASALGIQNLTVMTEDMNTFAPKQNFDRVVSVEMFEHMTNWANLLARVKAWVAPNGQLFIHVFSHRAVPYRFDRTNTEDWIAQHFFTGGIMPSHTLIKEFSRYFSVAEEWSWNGVNYERTARDWLANFDRNSTEIMKIFEGVYGLNAALWHRRWRIFFLSTAGLFGFADGREWGVSHYRLKPTP